MPMIPVRGPNWHSPEWYREEAERCVKAYQESFSRETSTPPLTPSRRLRAKGSTCQTFGRLMGSKKSEGSASAGDRASPKLARTQQRAYQVARPSGVLGRPTLQRYPGGYWSWPGQPFDRTRRPPIGTWVGTATVMALIRAGLAEWGLPPGTVWLSPAKDGSQPGRPDSAKTQAPEP